MSFYIKKSVLKNVMQVLIVSALFYGCSTDKPELRKQEKWLEYAGMSPEARALIEKNCISKGMTKDAVYIVLGEPDEEFKENSPYSSTFRWGYGPYLGGAKPKVFYREIKVGNNIYLEKLPKRPKNTTDKYYSRVEIIFVNGRVVDWQLMGPQ
jgi:hypothetical protein